jgi:cytidylate kinase
MIKVLTIDREYGSGAAEIAQKLADRLGWKLWDQSLTDEIARRLECPKLHVERQEERRDPLYYRIFKAFLRGSYEGSQITPQIKLADAESIRQVSEQMVRKAASEGNCVIVGRGSAYYLRDQPDAFHVFVYAPFEEKVRRLQHAGKTEAEATELVQTVDRDRADFIRQNF